MNILWISTKAPWPAVDGGRLLMANTLRALTARGHRVTVVCPAAEDDPSAISPLAGCRLIQVATWRPPKVWHALSALGQRLPWTIVRHRPAALRRRLRQVLEQTTFDVVHAEQVQAWGVVETLATLSVPVVWRAQNVESDLWRQQAATARGPLAAYLALESRRLARFEGRAVTRAATTLTLTRRDAERLASLAGGRGRLSVLRAPFIDMLPDADDPLPGTPALVVLGSRGWRPNQEGAQWFVDQVWRRLLRDLPAARLHIFGTFEADAAVSKTAGVELWPAPEESRQAFAPGSILVVPLQVASGVRMKILEAWARGIPVVATSTAARGLEATDGEQLFIADDGPSMCRSIRALQRTSRRRRMVAAARDHLRTHHGLETVAAQLIEVYENAVAEHAADHSRRITSSGPTSSSTSST